MSAHREQKDRFLLREALPKDLADVRRLAAILHTVNLPDDVVVLRRIITASRAAFAGKGPPLGREYLFVLEDRARERVVGTSLIFAQHGSREAPHFYFDVLDEERYSETLGKHFKHIVLRLGANYDGPTEIGGLVLLPECRGDSAQLGKQLSYVRFLFMGAHPELFRRTVLSELLPPLLPDGTSPLWEHLGRKFTDLGYLEADRLSKANKEFIRTLFPHSAVYASLFPKGVQRMIGQVGPRSRGVQRMLERIGFKYTHRIDPFDGGPHYEARLRDVALVRATKRARVVIGAIAAGQGAQGLVARIGGGRVRFRALRAEVVPAGRSLRIDREVARALQVRTGDTIVFTPFAPTPPHRTRGATGAEAASGGAS